jgi:uridylate kinase
VRRSFRWWTIAATIWIGGSIGCGGNSPGGSPYFSTDQRAAIAHVEQLGGEVLVAVDEVDLSAVEQPEKVDDAALAAVAKLPRVSKLFLTATAVTDSGLETIGTMTDLVALKLDGTQVTDAGLVHLKSLSKLRTLEVRSTGVTDAGAAELREHLPGLLITH